MIRGNKKSFQTETEEDFTYRLVENKYQKISGLITFAILLMGNLQQLLFLFYKMELIVRSKKLGYLKRKKWIRMKTLLKTTLYTNLYGLIYWTYTTLVHYIEEEKMKFKKIELCVYLFISINLLIIPANYHFIIYKNRLKANRIFENLLDQA